jgi:uncharacterized protein YjiK
VAPSAVVAPQPDRMLRNLKLAALLIAAPFAAHADILGVDLGNYRLTGSYALNLSHSPKAWEASGVTWNPDNNHLYVIEDEGRRIYETTTSGVVISSMTLVSNNSDGSPTGFEDTEGITYAGNGQFVLTQERRQALYQFSYVPNSTLVRNPGSDVTLGEYVNNIGIEGVSYDSLTGGYWTVKEKDPEEVKLWSIDFATGAHSVLASFDPTSLGLADIADITVLSNVPGLAGKPDQQNLLLLSQESRKLVEVDRQGHALSMFDLSSMSGSIEGVTIDNDGTIYLVSEDVSGSDPHLFVLTPKPVPLPPAAVLFASGLGVLALVRRRRKVAAG